MPEQVVSGAVLQCSMGTTPGSLTVLPTNHVEATGPPAANIMDHISLTNIPSFGMCTSLANPQVAAATAAAMGVLTPQPCIPNTPSPWTPGALTVQIVNQPALDKPSICPCVWAGIISVTMAGEETVEIP